MKTKQLIYWITGAIVIAAIILVIIMNQGKKDITGLKTEGIKTDTVEMIETDTSEVVEPADEAEESPADETTETDVSEEQEPETTTQETAKSTSSKTAKITREVTEPSKIGQGLEENKEEKESDVKTEAKVIAATVIEKAEEVKIEATREAPEAPAPKVEMPKKEETVMEEPNKTIEESKVTEKVEKVEKKAVEKTVEVAEATQKTENTAAQQTSNWKVPTSAREKTNPVEANKESLSIGKSLYKKHCKSCHGKEGLGDGSKAAQLDTPSGDFSTTAFQAQKDGTLFYKTVKGRDDMPSYRKKIPDEEDIWHIVNYMRTFKQ